MQKTAIITDWLTTFAGAEHVIRELCMLFPDATVFSTVYKEGSLPDVKNKIVTSPLQKWYKRIGDHRLLLPWMPRAVENFDLRGYDLVISSSHAVAKGCIPQPTTRHICYCHTPIRYAWDMEEQYLNDFHLRWPLRQMVQRQLKKIREWDRTTAKRVDTFIANSQTVRERINRIYGRESVVIHPPVDDRFFRQELIPTEKRIGYSLTVGRLVPYKRFDLAILAANALGLPLKVAGTGSEERRLRAMAGPTVTFLGRVDDEHMPALYGNARALIFPAEEDAGIVPLEAMTSGTPVIAYGNGGTVEMIAEGKTGGFFAEQSVPSLVSAIRKQEKIHMDPTVIRKHAEQFSSERFRRAVKEVIGK